MQVGSQKEFILVLLPHLIVKVGCKQDIVLVLLTVSAAWLLETLVAAAKGWELGPHPRGRASASRRDGARGE